MKGAVRHAIRWAMTLHIYVSMAGMLLVLFFGVTGITLNHADAMVGPEVMGSGALTVPAALAKAGGEASVTREVRRQLGTTLPATDYREDDETIELLFSGPADRAQVQISRADGAGQYMTARRGTIGLWNDLHRGAESGPVWKWVIDFSSGLLIFSALSGLFALVTLPKRRRNGIIAAGVGVVVILAIYVGWVPR